MARVTGLGGIFCKAADPAKTQAWYKEMLGIGGEWGGIKIELWQQLGPAPAA